MSLSASYVGWLYCIITVIYSTHYVHKKWTKNKCIKNLINAWKRFPKHHCNVVAEKHNKSNSVTNF